MAAFAASVRDSFYQLFRQARRGIKSLAKRIQLGRYPRRVVEIEDDLEGQMSSPDSPRSPVSCTEYHDISDVADLENGASLDARAHDQ